jgi:hypothetical protein
LIALLDFLITGMWFCFLAGLLEPTIYDVYQEPLASSRPTGLCGSCILPYG